MDLGGNIIAKQENHDLLRKVMVSQPVMPEQVLVYLPHYFPVPLGVIELLAVTLIEQIVEVHGGIICHVSVLCSIGHNVFGVSVGNRI